MARRSNDGVAAMIRITRDASARLRALRFAPPVAHVYDPLAHAAVPHERWLRRYGDGVRRVVLLGMNPGPFGMVQTGVPFGEVELVRDWLGIDGKVERPAHEHPKRPVLGFACTRSEVSGRRLWSWCRDRFGTPERFFATFWVHNYCPLAFMSESGSNLTPDRLPSAESRELFEICDDYLRGVVAIVRPELVVGIGAFAEKRARAALAGTDVAFGRIPHPSPASPAANCGWAALAEAALRDLGIDLGPASGVSGAAAGTPRAARSDRR
jgi:single-strand selective monofunctional uracil DNA glycosylase